MNYFGIFFSFIFIPMLIIAAAVITAYIDENEEKAREKNRLKQAFEIIK